MFDKWFKRTQASEAQSSARTDPCRWVVLDTETTGLNIKRDHVLSIAALALHLEPGLQSARISLSDTFEAVIRQDAPKNNKDNILIHHIGLDAQGHGREQAHVLKAFCEWVGDAPLFAYHADFDRAMLAKSYKACSLPALPGAWVDVQPLANWVTRQTHRLGLDECAMRFGLHSIVRHQAASDTFLTAELLLRLLPQLRLEASDFAAIERIAIEHASQSL